MEENGKRGREWKRASEKGNIRGKWKRMEASGRKLNRVEERRMEENGKEGEIIEESGREGKMVEEN